uniref:Uncharacterized protein n=1 Tax=Rhizophora mucronata TaxID=61149 RepID=A0A2P2QYB4_RHIMU
MNWFLMFKRHKLTELIGRQFFIFLISIIIILQ